MSSTTVTVMLPGFTVSVQSAHAPTAPADSAILNPASGLLAVSVTVVLWPDASVPAAGATVTLPIRPEDSVMDQSTDPNEAVKVSVPPLRPSRIEVGVTARMPRPGAEDDADVEAGDEELAVAVLVAALEDVLGAGVLALLLALDAAAADVPADACPLLPGEPAPADPAPDPAPAAGAVPPGAGVGDTRTAPLADTVGCGRPLGPPVGPLLAAALVPGPDPAPRASAAPPP